MALLDTALDRLGFYFASGGFVMAPLALATVVLWFAIGYRMSVLRRPDRRSVRRLIEKYQAGADRRPGGLVEAAVVDALAVWRKRPRHLRRRLDAALADAEQELKKYSRITKAIIAVAPILGLLGTVSGMIETFDALGEMTLYSQSGGIAGGISQALFTTQLGLAVAIPGLVVHGMLERRAAKRRRELAQVKDILCAREAAVTETE